MVEDWDWSDDASVGKALVSAVNTAISDVFWQLKVSSNSFFVCWAGDVNKGEERQLGDVVVCISELVLWHCSLERKISASVMSAETLAAARTQ